MIRVTRYCDAFILLNPLGALWRIARRPPLDHTCDRRTLTMHSPRQPERRDVRYPVQLPVVVKLAGRAMLAHSENISLNGILVSSEFLIPERSRVELLVAVPSVFLTGRGRVVRVRLDDSGGFAAAIACERPFRLTSQSSTVVSALRHQQSLPSETHRSLV